MNAPAVTPAPTPTIKKSCGAGVQQRRDVAEHALEAHVDVHVGRFDLAAMWN